MIGSSLLTESYVFVAHYITPAIKTIMRTQHRVNTKNLENSYIFEYKVETRPHLKKRGEF